MRVVVSGAGGPIGAALTDLLESQGDHVVRLTRGDPGSDMITWDPDAGRIDAAGLEGADAVVHLAAEPIAPPLTKGKRERVLGSRSKGTRLLALTLAGLDQKPNVLLSASAIGFYGNRGNETLTETSTAGTGFLSEVVLQWEAATRPAEEAGIRVVHARTGLVLTSRGGALSRLLIPFRLGLGGRLGSGRQWWSWISLTDEVRAMAYCIETEELSGAVNLTSPSPVTNAEFTKQLGAVLRRPSAIAVPATALRLALGSDLAEGLVLASARVMPERLLQTGFSFRHEQLDEALAAEL
ncbi:MAG TPA: TIGR01777 family oxidoreductase [Acidimicrobiia bacterium]|nr:TIGR01777 family oxidoreductase [Acidimicrobiia bacterium]